MTTNTTTAPSVDLDEFTIRRPEGEDIIYRDDYDGVPVLNHEGRLDVRLGVDGMWTIVTADRRRTAQLTLIERVIAALSEVRDQLDRMAPESAREGNCLAQGDWGRCYGKDGHAGDHEWPTEESWRSANNVPTASGTAHQ